MLSLSLYLCECENFSLNFISTVFASAHSPEMEAPYSNEEEKMRLLDLYRYMHSRIHSTSRPLKLIYHVAERETLLAWVCSCVFMDESSLFFVRTT